MSMFNYYRYNSVLDKPITTISNEDNVEVSTEGFIDKVKNILERIKNFIKVIAKNIWKGLMAVFNFFFKRKEKEENQIKALKKNDIIALYQSALAEFTGGKITVDELYSDEVKEEMIGENGRTIHFINQDGSIIDIAKTFKEYDTAYKDIIKEFHGDAIKIADNLNKVIDRSKTGLNVVDLQTFKKVDIPALFNLINPKNMMKYYFEMKNNIPKEMSRVDSDIEKVIKEVNRNPFKYKKNNAIYINLQYLQQVITAKFQTYQAIVGFYRIISSRLNKGFGFTEPVKDNEKLYHLSFDDELVEKYDGVLSPRVPDSAHFKDVTTTQILPNRTSFSADIAGCSVGLMFRAKDYLKHANSKELFFVTALYRGIPNALPDKPTMKVKAVYAKETIDEYDGSKEIPITSEIKIEKVGYVKVYLNRKKATEVKLTSGQKFNWGLLYSRHEMIDKETFDKFARKTLFSFL